VLFGVAPTESYKLKLKHKGECLVAGKCYVLPEQEKLYGIEKYCF